MLPPATKAEGAPVSPSVAKAAPPLAETALPILVEIAATDARLRFSAEDARVDLNALERLILPEQCGLQRVLEKAGANAQSRRLLRIEVRLDQTVLLDVSNSA